MANSPGLLARVLRRLGRSSRPRGASTPLPEVAAVLDGASTALGVAAVAGEAIVIERSTTLGQRLRAHPELIEAHNALEQPIEIELSAAEGTALAMAAAYASAGLRAVAVVDSDSLEEGATDLERAVMRHVPLVVIAEIGARPGPDEVGAGGHEAYHTLAELGCGLSFASDLQELVDLTLFAHRVAEASLVPHVVAIDRREAALGLEGVALPSGKLAAHFLGRDEDIIESPTPAQRMIFGPSRRRVPRMFDLDQSLMIGALHGEPSRGLAAAGLRPFFSAHVPELTAQAREAFSAVSPRDVGPLRLHGLDGAKQLIVAQGKLVDVAVAAAERVHALHDERVGVVGLRTLRPLPGAELVEALRGRKLVTVLERSDAPLSDTPPLTREVRDLLARARENAERRDALHSDVPALALKKQPTVCSARIGLAGAALRVADIVALCRSQSHAPRTALRVGLPRAEAAEVSRTPKREALMQALLGGYPSLDAWTVGDAGSARAGGRPHDSLSLVVVRGRDGDDADIAMEAARLVEAARAGVLRGRLAQRAGGQGQVYVDAFVQSTAGDPGDPGEPMLGDVVLMCHGALERNALAAAVAATRPHGALIVDASALAASTPDVKNALKVEAKRHSLHVHTFERRDDPPATAAGQDAPGALRHEAALGALVRLALAHVDVPTRKLPQAREEALAGLDEATRERRVTAFRAALADHAAVVLDDDEDAEAAASAAAGAEAQVPWLVRRFGPSSPGVAPVGDLATFWGEVGVLYRRGEADNLVVEPSVAIGAAPPLSAALQVSAPRELPRFDAARCVGCGLCWSVCPDAALAPSALDVGELLEAGMGAASRAGKDVDALRPLLGKVAARVTKSLVRARSKSEPIPAVLGEVLPGPFIALMDKAGFAEERRATVEQAFSEVLAAVAPLPVACTSPLFDAAEADQSGSGAMLSVVLDAAVCKGCGLCSEVCAEAVGGESEPALTMVPADADNRAQAAELHALWTTLPDASGARIAAAAGHADFDALGALTLSRHSLLAYAGADGAEPGSGVKIALRATLAAAEVARQRHVASRRDALEALREKLAERVREQLAAGLPTGDINALAAGIESLDGGDVSLSELSRRVEGVVDSGSIDVRALERLTTLSSALDRAIFQIGRGAHGLGRARYGVLLCPDGLPAELGVFPSSGFIAPLLVERAARVVAVARALVAGQGRAAIDAIALAHRAKVELDEPRRAELLGTAVPRLAANELSDGERAELPPLLLLAASSALDDGALAELLGSGMPIKLLLFADGGVERDGRPRDRSELEMIALARGQAFVAQSSVAFGDHLVETLQRALTFDGPAVLQVYAPSPGGHGFAPRATLARARDAVRCRLAPLLRYDPQREGVFGAQIDLEGNPEPAKPWISDGQGAALTPVQFCAGEARFAGSAGAAAAEALSRHVEARWRTLQELAGVATPFTARVRAEAEADLGGAHAAEVAALRGAHEQELAKLRAEHAAQVTAQVRDSLLRLAGFDAARATAGQGEEGTAS